MAVERMRVVVFDVDPANPYGRELAALLAETFTVETILPVDTQWLPAGIEHCRILPSFGPSSLFMQALRQARGLAQVAWSAFGQRATVVVVLTRSWYDRLALALFAMMGARIIVIAHDPVPKRPSPRLMAFSRHLLWRRAAALVAHSAQLAAEASAACGRPAETVPHLPFTEYAAWARKTAPDARAPGRCGLLVLGHMREDKGLDRIPAILESIPAGERSRFSLSFAGRGDCIKTVVEVARLVDVTREPTERLLSDTEIAEELARSDVLFAPYPHVSASGSVVLALSRGLRVVAYDTGALSEVVAPSGLVAPGDERGMAERLVAAARSECGGPARPPSEWRAAGLQAWSKVLVSPGREATA